MHPRGREGITNTTPGFVARLNAERCPPPSSSCEPLITQSMIHYPCGDPRSSGRRAYIEWHNNNSLPDHLTFTIEPPPLTLGRTGTRGQWLIRTVGSGGHVVMEKKSHSSPLSASNVTCLIRDGKTMQRGRRGWRGGRVWSNQNSCFQRTTVCTPPSSTAFAGGLLLRFVSNREFWPPLTSN